MAYKKILFRRDTSANWTSANPVLSAGEIGLETNTNKIKLGDGSTAWSSLPYFYGSLTNATLDDVGDVTITSPVTWDFLKYQGGTWVNVPAQDVASTANPTFAGVTADNIRVGVTGANEIDTATGNLTIDSAGGTVTVDDNLVVSGNLTVDGTTTTLNTETLAVEDNIIVLNSNVTGAPSTNAGVEIERGSSTNVQLRWNETSDVWQITTDGTTYYNIIDSNVLEDRFSQELWHKPVRLATTTVLPNSPSYTAGSAGADGGTGIGATLTATTYGRLNIDSVNAEVGGRVLVKDQANSVHNGIYTVTAQGGASEYWVLTRAADMNGSYQYQTQFGESMYIASGVINGLQTFACSSFGSLANNVHVIGSDQITFEGISGTVTVKPGNGLTATDNALNINTADAGRIVVNADNIDLATVTQTNVTTSTNSVFLAGINVDGYGRITGATSSSVEIALGTNTTGNYVSQLVAGTGVSITNNAAESASPTIAIGQAVNTDSTVTFLTVNANLTGNVTGNVLGNVTGSLTGNASTVTNGVYTTDTGSVTNTMLAGSIADTKLNTISTSGKVSNSATTATSANTASAIVARDANGDFTAGVVTANSVATAKTYVGTTEVALNRASANLALTGISSVALPGSTSGTVTVQPASTAGTTTITLPATTGTVITSGDTGTVNSTMIADGTIVNGDINASAGIALSKLASGTSAQVVLANSSGVPTYTSISGDIAISATGVATIQANSVALGTDTTGNYVASLVEGTGVTITNNSGETSTPTVAIGQAVSTSSSVTFAQVTTTGNVIVGGDLQVSGTMTTVNQTSLAIEDPLIYLNDGSTITDPDLGFAGNYNDGTYRHAGLFSDASDSHKFKFFKGLTVEPTAPIDTSHASYAAADVEARTFSSTVTTGTAPLSVSSSTVVTNLNADYLDGQSGAYYAPIASPTFTGTVTLPSGTVTSGMIADGTIVNADISSSASIDLGKIADVSTNAQSSSYTLVLADKNKIVEMGVSSANTLTVPLNSSVAFPVGSQINVLQTGTGQTTITPAGGVTINGTPGLKTRAQWSYVTLIKRATDTWVAVGDLSA
jgi:hypothetical protein